MGAQEHKTKVISNTLNPKWNASMQFTVRDVDMDALCITVFDRDLFSPNGNIPILSLIFSLTDFTHEKRLGPTILLMSMFW